MSTITTSIVWRRAISPRWILCTDKNDAVVKYTLGREQSKKIFASRYKLYLPSEQELRAEIQREVRRLPDTKPKRQPRQRATKLR